jgi:hypothetical protein
MHFIQHAKSLIKILPPATLVSQNPQSEIGPAVGIGFNMVPNGNMRKLPNVGWLNRATR